MLGGNYWISGGCGCSDFSCVVPGAPGDSVFVVTIIDLAGLRVVNILFTKILNHPIVQAAKFY